MHLYAFIHVFSFVPCHLDFDMTVQSILLLLVEITEFYDWEDCHQQVNRGDPSSLLSTDNITPCVLHPVQGSLKQEKHTGENTGPLL